MEIRKPLSRRDLLIRGIKLSPLLVSGTATIACAGQNNNRMTGAPACAPDECATVVTPESVYTDIGISAENPSIKSLTFSFDKASGGRLIMIACFTNSDFYTILTQEKKPNPGTLIANTYLFAQDECDMKNPVVPFNIGDVETVYIGTGIDPDATYEKMRVYEFRRDPAGKLFGQYTSTEAVDPKALKLR